MGYHCYDVGCGVMGFLPTDRKYHLYEDERAYSDAFEEANKPYANIIWLD